jgi:hypothetical protein
MILKHQQEYKKKGRGQLVQILTESSEEAPKLTESFKEAPNFR